MLSNSGCMVIISSVFTCNNRSFNVGFGIRSNAWYARPYGLNMYVISQPKMKQINFRNRPLVASVNMVADIESGLFDEEKQSQLTGIEKKESEMILTEVKLPPWGDVAHNESLGSEHGGVSELLTYSKDSKETVLVNKCRVYFLEEMDEELLSKRILVLSRTNKVRSAVELYRSMEFSGLHPNSHACNSFLSCLLRNGLLDYALEVYEHMRMNKVTTGHTYSLILKAVANARGCNVSLKMFKELEQEFVVKKDFDPIVYNTMISVCGKVNNWIDTERIWRSMKESGLVGTKITYSLLVSIFVRSGQNELAIDAYNEMVQKGLGPQGDTMQAVISACTKEGKWDLALSIFGNMLNRKLNPNLITCNALINSLGKAGEIKLAFWVYSILKLLGHMPDVYTWNALLGTLYKANQHAASLEFFENIKRDHGSELNTHLYNTALMSCSKLRLWDTALQFLWEMEASGLPVSTTSYNLVIRTCEIARKPKVALQVYEHMLHQNCPVDTFTHLSLVRSCIWGSMWDEVEGIMNVSEDVSVYNVVIQGMCLRSQIDSAKKLYREMRERGLQPDGKTRALMLQNLSNSSSVRRKKRWSSRYT